MRIAEAIFHRRKHRVANDVAGVTSRRSGSAHRFRGRSSAAQTVGASARRGSADTRIHPTPALVA